MCSERALGCASRERPVDQWEICNCSAPESFQVILRRIQILSFEASTGGVSNAAIRSPLHASFPNEDRQAA